MPENMLVRKAPKVKKEILVRKAQWDRKDQKAIQDRKEKKEVM